MRHMITFALLCLALPAHAQENKPAGPAAGQVGTSPYYPTKIGSTWTYRVGSATLVTRVVAHEKIGDLMCVRVEAHLDGKPIGVEHIAVSKEGLLRAVHNNSKVSPPVLILKLSANPGDSWNVEDKSGKEIVKGVFTRSDEDVVVPGFSGKCIVVRGAVESNGKKTSIANWYAEGKGVVKLTHEADGKGIVAELLKFEQVPLVVDVEGVMNQDAPKVKVDVSKGATLELRAKVHEVRLVGGRRYRVDMTSTDFDAYLVVQDKTGKQLAFDDDSGGYLNSRLFLSPPKDDVYKIYTADYNGKAGKFNLRIMEEPTLIPQVGKGLSWEGELSPAAKERAYQVNLVEGKTYVVDMISADAKALDPFLYLRDAAGKELARDDDGGRYPNARITFKAPATGVYQIVASSFQEKGDGKYGLGIREAGPLQVGKGLKFDDKLTAQHKYLAMEVTFVEGKTYIIDMTSPDAKAVDPYLYLRDAAGKELARNDDGGGYPNARIEYRAPATGTYQIVASSYMEKGDGPFTLAVREKE